jgi:GTP-binding protein
MPFTDVPILFCIGFDQAAFVKALEATVKVYENRQQRIATSKFNEFMLKVIEAYPPPATKEICKIKWHMQLPTNHSLYFFANMPQYVKEPYKRYLENKIRKLGFFRVPIDIYIREK